ncbi:phosphotransferase family protein [Rhodococcus sp. NPDC003382]|uniref:phosphotransferase family protein n=1 Tax=Rhodococcus sp. HM1 TaxID=2937759 RepID=UPI00200A0DC3|nr:phosphotransferase family protein [Rhodococcus sp. HM1]MCK8669757.1 phosphotransferase family protein [Rhodococcus sp. HM1]
MTSLDDKHLLADLALRATRAGREWRDGLTVSGVRPLTGGSSSLTFIADASSSEGVEQVVLKVAPPGLEPVRNRDVVRQGRLMNALHGVPGVKVPAVYFSADGESLEVPPFVAMEFVTGECVEPLLEDARSDELRAQTHARFLDAARMLGNLHRVSHEDVGLGCEPVVTLESEIDRWTKAFTAVPEDLQGDYRVCEKALRATIPAPMAPVVNHGDFRLGNTLCDGDRVTSIIDWEIWSVGDPRIDLTWLTYFTDEARHPARPHDEPCGAPSIEAVVREYERSFGGTVPDLAWFDALTRYKEAAATALLIKRARKHNTMNPSFARMEPALPDLLREALTLVGA